MFLKINLIGKGLTQGIGKISVQQTLLLSFKCANHRNKRSFVSTANEALVPTNSKVFLRGLLGEADLNKCY